MVSAAGDEAMTEQTTNRRAEDKNMQVLATKIEGLAQDITEMRASVVKMTDALVKFAVIEERQTQTILAQDRITMTIDRVSLRLDNHEKSCQLQEKELRALVFDTAKDLSQRLDALEKAEPMQEQAGKWVMAAVWGAAGLAALLIAKQLGLM